MPDGSLFGRVAGPIAFDLFAGGGGASLGIQWATGQSPVVAINHCLEAIEMHTANHPETEHYHASVYDVVPQHAARGRAIDLLWASPDCTHHSRCLGGKPREKGKRALADVIIDWARDTKPRIIALENVPEWLAWGPLDEAGKPIKARSGEDFRRWRGELEALGYVVDYRILCAADYGVPTTRRRLFLVARRDGLPLHWPEPTHGKGLLPWVPASTCIDWSIRIPSIFERKKPLAEATQRRIAEGIRRYVLTSADPFLLCLTHGGRLEPLTEPLRTTTTAHRGERAIVVPTMLRTDMHSDGHLRGLASVDEPLRTITTSGGHALAAATLINTRNGERKGQRPRVQDIRAPLGTVTAVGSQGALVAAFLDKLHGSARAGQSLGLPHPTVAAGGGRGGGHSALCAAFLMRYYGSGGQWSGLDVPMPTVTSREGLALVTTTIGGEEWVLVDIGMRMLQPRELARAQGFPDDYQLTGNKGQQVERIGNSVVPQLACAIAAANLGTEMARAAK